jgi:hypothetical protein
MDELADAPAQETTILGLYHIGNGVSKPKQLQTERGQPYPDLLLSARMQV